MVQLHTIIPAETVFLWAAVWFSTLDDDGWFHAVASPSLLAFILSLGVDLRLLATYRG